MSEYQVLKALQDKDPVKWQQCCAMPPQFMYVFILFF